MNTVIFKTEKCKGCGLCVAACPKKIVALSKDNMNAKGFHPAEVTDPSACIACAFCAVMCPDTVITVHKEAV
jgi:2-oxoglutarate ferredoxin oxidoreductase subunit delta